MPYSFVYHTPYFDGESELECCLQRQTMYYSGYANDPFGVNYRDLAKYGDKMFPEYNSSLTKQIIDPNNGVRLGFEFWYEHDINIDDRYYASHKAVIYDAKVRIKLNNGLTLPSAPIKVKDLEIVDETDNSLEVNNKKQGWVYASMKCYKSELTV
jgi:hypothetical protein